MTRCRLLALTPLLLLGTGCLRTADRWLFRVLSPKDFDPADTPPAPDYATASAWAAHPDRPDASDRSIDALPAAAAPEAAVFYLHPTTAVGRFWNAPFDAPETIEATERGGTLIQASAFSGCCAVWAPRYRQANGRAFTEPDALGDRAVDIAYGDVLRAFEVFLAAEERPLIVASHSQGTMLAARLLRERLAGTPDAERLVAAYLVGGDIHDGDTGFPVCQSATQTGCVVGWNARTEGYVPNRLEFDALRPDPLSGRVCVNPITWTTDGTAEPAQNAGAVFLDTDAPALLPGFVGARCADGRLIITEPGDMDRDLPSRMLLTIMGPGNYHPVEYQLFYADIWQNAIDRVAAMPR